MEKICGCTKSFLDIEDASYVLNGFPYCKRECFERAIQEENLRSHRLAVAYAMRAIPVPKETG